LLAQATAAATNTRDLIVSNLGNNVASVMEKMKAPSGLILNDSCAVSIFINLSNTSDKDQTRSLNALEKWQKAEKKS
jgi:hypothetical protein